MVEWENILITGASSGIGAALAEQFAAKAKTLILVARRKELLEALTKKLEAANPELDVLYFPIDLTISQNQQEVINELNDKDIGIDILINNAGLGDENYFHESKIEKLQQIIDLNIKSVVNFTHLLLTEMMKSPSGKGILFIGSGAGIAWMPGSAVYSASKHFITAFAMNLKSELEPYGMHISIAAPGPVDSEFDKNAGIQGGMKGGPTQKARISSEECAVDIVNQLERGKTLILPGNRIRRLMKLYINLPWFIRKKMLLKDGRKMYREKIKTDVK